MALSFLLARLGVRARLRQSRLFWVSDVLLIVGLGSAIGSSACDTLEFQMGALSDFQSTSERLWKVCKDEEAFSPPPPSLHAWRIFCAHTLMLLRD